MNLLKIKKNGKSNKTNEQEGHHDRAFPLIEIYYKSL